jgi:hypothetical protein
MPTKINREDLGLLKAIQTIKKYHEKEDSGQKEFDRDVWTLIEALLKTATQTHICPVCESSIKLFIHFN